MNFFLILLMIISSEISLTQVKSSSYMLSDSTLIGDSLYINGAIHVTVNLKKQIIKVRKTNIGFSREKTVQKILNFKDTKTLLEVLVYNQAGFNIYFSFPKDRGHYFSETLDNRFTSIYQGPSVFIKIR